MVYYEEDIQSLIDSLDIVDIIGKRVDLKKSGASYKGLCPFHGEKSPSFMVNSTKNIFKCFGCGVAGNAFSFYMKINNLQFIEAVEALSKEYNIPLRIKKGHENNGMKQSIRERYFDLLYEAMLFFKDNLFSIKGRNGLEYFEDRGLNLDFIIKNNLGYSIDSRASLQEHFVKKGYTEDELINTGLIKKGDKGCYDVFRGRVMFPISSFDGKIIGFGGRIIDNNKEIAKYLNSPDTEIFNKGKNIYGLSNRGEAVRKKDYVILMEGYMDVLSAHSFGVENAVASLGTAFTDEQAKLLRRLTSNIVMAYDMDAAGRKAIERAAHILKRNEFNVRVLELDDAKDPDEYLKKNGKKDFIERIQKSKEIFDFLYQFYSEGLDINDITGKKNLAEKFSEFLKNVPNTIEQSLYLDKLSKNLNVEKGALKDNIIVKSKPLHEKKSFSYTDKSTSFEKTELLIIQLVLKDRKYLQVFKEQEIEYGIKDLLLTKIFNIIDENAANENIESLILEELTEEEQKKVINVIFGYEDLKNEEELTSDILDNIIKRKKQVELDIIKNKLNNSQLSEEEKRSLTLKYYEIIRSMKN